MYDANAEESYPSPEILVGEGIGSGRIWQVMEGRIRLPEGTLINGAAPGAADEASRWDLRKLKGALAISDRADFGGKPIKPDSDGDSEGDSYDEDEYFYPRRQRPPKIADPDPSSLEPLSE